MKSFGFAKLAGKPLLYPSAADIGFDAAPVAAIAIMPVGVDAAVSPFAGNRHQARPQFSVNRDPAAAPGSDDHAEYHVLAFAGAEVRLGQRKAVCIVFDFDGVVNSGFNIGF